MAKRKEKGDIIVSIGKNAANRKKTATGQKTVSKSAESKTPEPAARRSALGRGLGSLMRSTLIEVDVQDQLAESQSPITENAHESSAATAEAIAPIAISETPTADTLAVGTLAVSAPAESASAPASTLNQVLPSDVRFPDATDVTAAATRDRLTESNAASSESRSFVSDFDPDVESSFESEEEEEQPQIRLVSLAEIKPNKDQPRKRFKDEEIEALANSIRESGLLQPIVVRERAGGVYEIVAGERRFRAASRIGLRAVPVIVRKLSDRETLELSIVENVQRSDLNPVEVAQAYQRLIEDFGLTQDEVAKSVGKDRVSIANSIRLLKLPNDILMFVKDELLSAGHARALLMLDSAGRQRLLAEKVIREKLSVRATEALARDGGAKAAGPRATPPAALKREASKSPAVLELEERLRGALGTKVSLSVDAKGAGELKVSFFSNEELDRLLQHML